MLPVKGHRFLVEACGLLLKRDVPRFQCSMLGDGPLETTLRQQIERLGLQDIVKVPGRVSHDELLGSYARGEVDIVVLPSIATSDGHEEGIPVSLMEAMAWGIPVVSTSTGGIHELVGDGAGLVVPERDPVGLADAVETLMLNGQHASQLSEAGRRRVEQGFDVKHNAARLLEWMELASAR